MEHTPEQIVVSIIPTTEILPFAEATPLTADRNPAVAYLSSLRVSGRQAMQFALNTLATELSGGHYDAFSFPWQTLRYQHTRAITTRLYELTKQTESGETVQRFSGSTVALIVTALRRVLKECWRLGLITAEEYQRAADVKPQRSQPLPKGRMLKDQEVEALLDSCHKDQEPSGLRDAALISVLYASGLRRAEVVKLKLSDYGGEEQSLLVRSGKGGKDRITYLGAGTASVLEEWLGVRGDEAGALFCPIRKNNKIVLSRNLTPQSVLWVLQRRATEAGLIGEGESLSFSPHDFRRTFISTLLENGNDVVTVQKLAGHSNIQTTARYDRRGEEAKKRAARGVTVPGQQKKNES